MSIFFGITIADKLMVVLKKDKYLYEVILKKGEKWRQ
jgi:hypothetical protein